MMYIIEYGLFAFSIFFSIGMAILMVMWISIGLNNLVENMEKRVGQEEIGNISKYFEG